MIGYKFGENNVGIIRCIQANYWELNWLNVIPTIVDDEYESSNAAS